MAGEYGDWYDSDWDLEAIVVQDTDGSILAWSEETDAYRIYAKYPELVLLVGEAQSGPGYDAEGWATHFQGHADTVDALRRALAERGVPQE